MGSGGGGGGSTWNMFVRTMKSAADGLNMAMGNKNITHTERHHVLSDKNTTYTPQYKEITDRYNYSLDHESNLVSLSGHRGRHTNVYHEFMLFALNEIDAIAMGDFAE